MSTESKHLNRRDMLKYGVSAMGMAILPERIISIKKTTGSQQNRQSGKEQEQLLSIVQKYGGEFGGIKPEGRK